MKNKRICIVSLILLALAVNAQNITVNKIRNFTVNESTIIRKDGVIINPVLNEIIGIGGYKMRFRVGENVNPTISLGTLLELDLITDIAGPITSLAPLSILEQKVFTTSETALINVPSVSSLQLGDIVSVSGAINSADNSMQASRLELNNNLPQWTLRGFARNITASNFSMGNLLINSNAVSAIDCSNGFVENVFVEVKAMPDASYVAGNPLSTLTNIQCQTPDVYEDPNNSIPVVVEAMVSEIIDLSSFRINDLVVFFDGSTSFDNGELEHIDVGTKLEVQGLLDTNTRFINATTIRFIHHRVKFVAPVKPADITLGEGVLIFGKQVSITPQTRDDDAIVSSGLVAERQIEVRGFVDSMGNVFALRVKDKGTPDNQDVKLRGDITGISEPNIEINSINIDSTASLFEVDDEYVDSVTFFAMIQQGMQVEIEDATYDVNTQVLTGGVIELKEQELEDDPDSTNKSNVISTPKEIIGIGGIGLATVTKVSIIETIFKASFE